VGGRLRIKDRLTVLASCGKDNIANGFNFHFPGELQIHVGTAVYILLYTLLHSIMEEYCIL
jgi:hypothetical protein